MNVKNSLAPKTYR